MENLTLAEKWKKFQDAKDEMHKASKKFDEEMEIALADEEMVVEADSEYAIEMKEGRLSDEDVILIDGKDGKKIRCPKSIMAFADQLDAVYHAGKINK